MVGMSPWRYSLAVLVVEGFLRPLTRNSYDPVRSQAQA